MGIYRGPHIVRDGLVLCLDGGSERSLLTSGTTWVDLVKDKSTVTYQNTVSYSSDNEGGINMDTGDEYLHITPSPTLASILPQSDLTVELVVRSDDVVYPRSRIPFYIGSDANVSTEKGWSIGHRASSTKLEMSAADGTTRETLDLTVTTIEESTTYHRVFTINRTTGVNSDFYLNGEFEVNYDLPNITGDIYNSGDKITLGYIQGWRFIGDIYIIKIYNRILSATEIAQNFNAYKNRFNL
jgi:hypothetical protein